MRYKKLIFILFICFVLLFNGCKKPDNTGGLNSGGFNYPDQSSTEHEHTYDGVWKSDENYHWQTATCEHTDEKGYQEAHLYTSITTDDDGYMVYRCSVCGYEKKEKSELFVTCVEGTDAAYSFSDGTLLFSGITENSVYSVSGQFLGNIVIDVDENYKFELELQGLSLTSSSVNPITITEGDKVTLTAKKDTVNYIYDLRAAIDDSDDSLHKAAIYSCVDLDIGGKGTLFVTSENNNGIHTKDDLKVKNLTLTVNCQDNALKGNDSVTVSGGDITLIAKTGDGIKTKNSDISSKGKQKGSITVSESLLKIYAACDGLDAAYNAVIDNESTDISIFTDKYSEYSQEVTKVSDDVYYIRYGNQNYKYSVKYYNSDDDYVWENATFFKNVSSGRNSYYYYSFPVRSGYNKIKVFAYASSQTQQQEEDYQLCTEYLSWNTSYDTIALSSRGYSWTNYTTTSNGFGGGPGGGFGGGPGGGFGGMDEGNTDKGDHSTKGIKAANEIIVSAGKINIKSYDDCLHANNDDALENGSTPTGNVTVSGGTLNLFSNDDAIHADGTATISCGDVTVTNCYEGVEGNKVVVSGGNLSVVSSDDGINGTGTSGTSIEISGGNVYVYAGGDGVDSNSTTSYSGIVFSGGKTVIISTSNGNSAIDTERGYSYTGGSVLAIMPSGGMTNEVTNCSNFSSIGSRTNKSLKSGSVVTVSVSSEEVIVAEMPCSLSAMIVYLGSNAATFTVK